MKILPPLKTYKPVEPGKPEKPANPVLARAAGLMPWVYGALSPSGFPVLQVFELCRFSGFSVGAHA